MVVEGIRPSLGTSESVVLLNHRPGTVFFEVLAPLWLFLQEVLHSWRKTSQALSEEPFLLLIQGLCKVLIKSLLGPDFPYSIFVLISFYVYLLQVKSLLHEEINLLLRRRLLLQPLGLSLGKPNQTCYWSWLLGKLVWPIDGRRSRNQLLHGNFTCWRFGWKTGILMVALTHQLQKQEPIMLAETNTPLLILLFIIRSHISILSILKSFILNRNPVSDVFHQRFQRELKLSLDSFFWMTSCLHMFSINPPTFPEPLIRFMLVFKVLHQ